jgi:hypothetical protein
LKEVKEEVVAAVLETVLDVLEEFGDVMPPEFPKTLPPKRVVDHKIKLLLGSTPPNRAPYQMSPKELVELQKQYIELQVASFIRLIATKRSHPVIRGTSQKIQVGDPTDQNAGWNRNEATPTSDWEVHRNEFKSRGTH